MVCCRGAEAEARLRPVALQRFQKFPPAAASPNSIVSIDIDACRQMPFYLFKWENRY